MMDIKKEIISNLKNKSNSNKITEDTKISDLNIDSLDLMELVMNAEEKLGAELPDDVITTLKTKTVGDVIKEMEKVAK
ncbi:MAG: acyl carrier protein [Mycoplasma sp.]|nr:acyl carrier protein [Mycoplasma sp.]